MLLQTSLGIDIQANAVSLVYLKASLTGIRLVSHVTHPIDPEAAQSQKVDLIVRVTKDFLGKRGVSPTAAFLGVPRDTTIIRYVELPLVVKENLGDILHYEMEKYIPLPAEALYFDYQIISEDKADGKLTLLLLAAKRESVNPYIALEQELGIRFSGIEVSSTAAANFFSSRIDSNGKDVYALVYQRRDGLEIDLLRSSGALAYSRPVCAMQRGHFADDIHLTLKKLKAALKESEPPLKTVLCDFEGDNALVTQLEEDEDFAVQHFDPSSTGVPSTDIIAAYGLALKGVRKVATDVNLLPVKMRKRPGKAGHYAMFGLTGAMLFLALVWGGGVIYNQHNYSKSLDIELNRLKREVAALKQIRAECAEMERRIDFLAPIRSNRLTVLDVIKELSERVPKNAWLLRFTFSGEEKEVQVAGWADSASELIPKLDGSPLFKDVGFLSSITRTSAGKERFSIGLKLAK